MPSFPRIKPIFASACCLLISVAIIASESFAQSGNLRFQRPGAATATSSPQKFRRPGSTAQKETSAPELRDVQAKTTTSNQNPLRPAKQVKKKKVAKKKATSTVTRRQAVEAAAQPLRVAKQASTIDRNTPVQYIGADEVQYETDLSGTLQLTNHECAICPGDCTCEVSCGICDVGCGCPEPVCGCPEPMCGCPAPSCGIIEPGCGCADPNCSSGVGCGSCVGNPGPDYWCFPVCLPRLKDLSVWGGVQGFRGPRDFLPPGESNSNFGFHEGFNLSGRAPLVGLLFPQLSYQLGYQAVQSRLHGTGAPTPSAQDRSQQFVTAGLFRRVHTGLQFGVVWDMMDDDLDTNIDLQQIRSEISLKSPRGREIGFWSAVSTNSAMSSGTTFETTNQYAGFYRCNFGNSYEARIWGGGTDQNEGIVGAEIFAPLSDRWSVRSGFNYLITDEADGAAGVQEEAWNVGISMVWHMGRNARRGCRSPFRPLFSVADNGWMFVDQK